MFKIRIVHSISLPKVLENLLLSASMVLKIHMDRKLKHAFPKKNKIKEFPPCLFLKKKNRINFDVMGALNMSGRMLSKELV